MKSGLYSFICLIVVITSFTLFSHPLSIFALSSDKDLTLDDGSGDSPQLILKDETGDNTLTVQKMDAGEADIINDEGDINLKPSGDTDDYLNVHTTGDASYLYWLGISVTNNPGLRVDPIRINLRIYIGECCNIERNFLHNGYTIISLIFS